jgi:hypothetical protein
MEPEGSLPYSQVPTTSPYPEPTPSSPHNPSDFMKTHLNIILPSTSWSPLNLTAWQSTTRARGTLDLH